MRRPGKLRRARPAATVQGVSTDPLAALVAILERQEVVLERLAGAVDALSARPTSAPIQGRASTSPPRAVETPLTANTDPAVQLARMRLGAQHALPADALLVFAEYGGRGLYRRHRKDLLERPAEFRRAVVRDAQAEDPAEAIRMGADLLKVWDADDSPPE